MTVGVSIPLEAKGGQVTAEFQKVAEGVHKIARAEDAAAAAAHRRGRAQQGANQHSGGAHGGGHGGFAGGLHSLGFAGGEVGHLGHKLGRASHLGGMAVGAAGLGLAANAIKESLEYFDERMAEVVKKSAELAAKLHQAGKAVGQGGLSTAQSQGLAIQRLSSAGASEEDIKNAAKQGLSPSAFAEIYGTRNQASGTQAAVLARRFGLSSEDAAKMIRQMGGVGDGAKPIDAAAYLAGRAQNRVISPEEIARAASGEGKLSGQLRTIESLGGRAAVGGISAIESGKAASAAADQLNRTLNPEAAAMTDAWKKATEESEVLNTIAENGSKLLAIMETFTPKGSKTVQAIRAQNDAADVLMSGGIGGGSE